MKIFFPSCYGLCVGWKRISRHETEGEGNKVYKNGRHCGNSRPAQGRTEVEQGSLVHFYTQGTRSAIRVLQVICWLNKACMLGWGRVGRIPSPYGVGREIGYTVPLIVTTWEREGQQGSGFSVPAFQHPPWFYLLFCPWVTTLTRDWTWTTAVKAQNPNR